MKKVILFSFLIIMHICIFGQPKKIYIENDEVKSIKRIWMELNYSKALEDKSPILHIKQSVFKEINKYNEIKYKIYDKISLVFDSYDVNDEVYLIIDGNVFCMNIINLEVLNRVGFSENTETILTADSVKKEVVTGYSQDNRRIVKISYELNQDIVNRIVDAQDISLRYYLGPRMITLKIKGLNLKKLKKLLSMN